jgi:hypothetical protein
VSRRSARRSALVAAAFVGLCVIATSAPDAAAHRGGGKWSLTTVMRRIDGAKVTIRRWSGRVRSVSTLCSGDGRGVIQRGTRRWQHFTCTWTVFNRRGGYDRDVTFRTHVLGTGRFVITDARFGAS